MENEKKIIKWNKIFLHHTLVSAVKKVHIVSDRIYVVLLGGRFSIIVLNMHTARVVNSDDSKDSFYE
jgi:hypothetical protein